MTISYKKLIGVFAVSVVATLMLGFSGSNLIAATTDYSYVKQLYSLSTNSTVATLTSAPSITASVAPGVNGAIVVATDELSVYTNSQTGYTLYISGYDSDSFNGKTALYYDSDPTDNIIETNQPSKIVGQSGNSPAVLSSPNTWGWAIATDDSAFDSNKMSFGQSGFSATTDYTSSQTPGSSSAKFMGLSSSELTEVISRDTANINNTPDVFTIYLGAFLNSNVLSGTYSNYIVYTMLVDDWENISVAFESTNYNSTDDPSIASASITSPFGYIGTDVPITISTDYTPTGTLAANMIKAYVMNSNGSPVGFCNNITNIQTNANGATTFNCDLYAYVTNGETVTIGSNTFNSVKAETNISYDVYVIIDEAETFTDPDYTHTEAFALYYQTPKTMFDITNMQEMKSYLCHNTPTPAVTDGTTTVYDFRGTTFKTTPYNPGTTRVPRTILTDTRDNKDYYVVKLADGNCWMQQNLDLNLSDFSTLTSADTDLNTISSWIPTGHWYDPGDRYCYGNTPGANQTCSSTMTVDKTEHAGDLYYYSTAMPNESNENSICPRGWQLPLHSASGKDKSAYKLLATYSIPISVGTSDAEYGSALLRSAPFQFSFHGFWGYGGYFQQDGGYGRWWLGNGNLTMHFSPNNVSPNTGGDYVDFSVRCVNR